MGKIPLAPPFIPGREDLWESYWRADKRMARNGIIIRLIGVVLSVMLLYVACVWG